MRVPLLDLSAHHTPLREEILSALSRCFDTGQFILGPEVESFERELARTVLAKHAVGLSSGTDALLAALMAIGVGQGDEVVTTPFTFFATAGAIARLGARPVFADIDPLSFHLDPAKAAEAASDKTRAVIPVHLFGRAASAPRVPVPIIEDAAQSIGAIPLAGTCGCLSFFPSKNLGALGDAGAIYTNDDAVADRVRLLRTHGSRPKYFHPVLGANFRLDAIHAAVLRVKLPRLAGYTRARRQNAERYRNLFQGTKGIPPELRLPEDTPEHIYNQFVVRAPRRDELRDHLARAGVGTEIYYPLPLHLQPCFAYLGYREGSLPHAERAAREVLALPIYPELTEEQQAFVVAQIASFY
ncbi:MAG: DegT/DnrJ/EryC1/StrS family aminotransferase [Deltaproteobacteria bacterium]|nr:DegT/DnrJ/EryC1/StrS family aminotransferase [Deltaproteobacteria bacterium]